MVGKEQAQAISRDDIGRIYSLLEAARLNLRLKDVLEASEHTAYRSKALL